MRCSRITQIAYALTFCIFFLIPSLGVSQKQVEIDRYRYAGGYVNSYVFNNRFDPVTFMRFSLGSTDFYKQHKINRVEIYDDHHVIQYMMELDTAGNVRSSARKNYHYYILTTHSNKDSTSIKAVQYFEGKKMARVDSTWTFPGSIRIQDTLIYFTRIITKIYKSGELINTQNTYYNSKKEFIAPRYASDISSIKEFIHYAHYMYLDQKRKVIKTHYRETNEGRIISKTGFRRDLKTTYDSASLYLSRTTTKRDDLYYWNDTVKIPLYHKNRWNQPSYDEIFKDKIEFRTEGENYVERSNAYIPYYCGYARSRDAEEERRTHYYYQDDKNGLHLIYFKSYDEKNGTTDKYPLYQYRYIYHRDAETK